MAGKEHELVDEQAVNTYAEDMKGLLEEVDITERRAFPRSFVKRMEVNGDKATADYNLPVLWSKDVNEPVSVLPIDTSGGAGGTIGRTLQLVFTLTI